LRTRRVVLSTATSALLALGVLGTFSAPAHAAGTIVINEVESQAPGGGSDWVELYNLGASTADIGNYVLKDSTDGNNFTIPPGTTIAAGGFAAFDVNGLGSADSARLFDSSATQVDSYAWADHAVGTWGRCPDGTGAFTNTVSSRGAANICRNPTGSAWPGGSAVTEVDPAGLIGSDLSGLAYEGTGTAAPGTLWAVQNGNGLLHRLTKTGSTWAPAVTWALKYPGGTGKPDAEGVTLTSGGPAAGVYVSTERDGNNDTVSRPAVLRYAPSGPGGDLVATNDWNLSADLPGLAANGSLEAIAWVPDSYLTARGFRTSGGTAYVPGNYPNHGTGLFFVGVEQDGQIIAYALDQTSNSYTRVATVTNVFSTVADLDYDADLQRLRVVCDNTCDGRTALLDVSTTAGATQGTFVSTNVYERPAGMGNFNNEGFAATPDTECVGGVKPVFWADDGNDNGHALRAGTLSCSVTPPSLTATASSTKAKSAAGWYAAPVTVSFTCTAGSAPLAAPCPAPVTLSSSGAGQSVSRTITDTAGRSAQAGVTGINIDTVAPTVAIKGVKKGKAYPRKKKPTCVATDALSGVASCVISQKKKGKKYVVTAVATDKAGNTATATLTYKLKPKKKK
jgi:hypothetical protein